MDKIIDKLDDMEAQIKVLNEEKFENKSKLRKLETKLLRSEKRIEELEKRSEKPLEEAKPSGMKKDDLKAIKKRLSEVERQQLRLQRHSQDATEKLQRLDKLQLLMNGIMLNKQQNDPRDLMIDVKSDVDSLRVKLEDMDAEMRRMVSKVDVKSDVESLKGKLKDADAGLKSMSAKVEELSMDCKKFEESSARLHFLSCIKMVKEHRLPLSSSDYWTLAGLEEITRNVNCPAYDIVSVNVGHADEDCAQRADELREEGIDTVKKAQASYVQICAELAASYNIDTLFYYGWVAGYGIHILAIGDHCLEFLDVNTKETLEHLSFYAEIHSCVVVDKEIVLTLKDASNRKFSTDEMIDEEVAAIIRRKIKKQ